MGRLAAIVCSIALLTTACAAGGEGAPDDGGLTVEQAQEALEDPATSGDGADRDAQAAAAGDDTTAGDDAPVDADGEAATVEALWWSAPSVLGDSEVSAPDELAGGNVVLWMWAPWCGVCNREAPEVAEALAELPDDVTVVGVAGRDELGPMEDFIARHGLEDITHVVDADGSIWGSYGISYQPAWVFVDADGNASVAPGALGRDGLLDAVDEVFGA